MKDAPFEFHPLKIEDLNLLYDWFQEHTIKEWYARGKTFSFEDIQAKYLPRIQKQMNVPSFIVYQHKKSIGFIQYYMLSEHLPDKPDSNESLSRNNPLFLIYPANQIIGIDCFIAHATHRGKRLGVKLLQSFIETFLSHAKAIIVDPDCHNHRAIRCYEKAGFKSTSFSETSKFVIMLKTDNLKVSSNLHK